MIQYCRWCDKDFKASSKHQIYCSLECRQLATKEKVIQRAQKQKLKRRMNKKRFCNSCGVEISIYNEYATCNNCYIDKKKVDKFLKDMRYLFNYEKE